MQNVPKIVSERLKAVPVPVDHPAPDLLTAFAEQALPETERVSVLDHLAVCGDCRDVVALALPEMETVETVPHPVRSSWLTWPALRWGFVAAGVVAIASFGVLQFQRGTRPQFAESRVSPSPQVSTSEAKNDIPSPPPPVAPSAQADKFAASRVSTAPANGEHKTADSPRLVAPSVPTHRPEPSANVGGPFVRGLNAGGASAGQQQSRAQAQAPADRAKQQIASSSQPAQPSPAMQTVDVQGESTAADTLAETPADTLAENDKPGREAYGVGKAKAPVASTVQPAAPAPSNAMPVIAANARWTISANGVLQRSFDQGSTWQDVVVAQNFPQSSSFLSRQMDAPSPAARDEVATKKAMKVQASGLIFRAVAANGAEVWAGGSDAALYHSFDAGAHWTRVLPTSAGAALTGDVVSVEFFNPQHGRIATSTNQVWTTNDDGQTWTETVTP